MSAYCTQQGRLHCKMMLQCVKCGKTLLSGQALPTHTDFASNEAPLIQASFYWPLRDGK
ncbi:hypothetical protein L2449_29350 [Mesorhizobium muleiense]|nr:hypothetical protein [Mesorhizobium muleiense]